MAKLLLGKPVAADIFNDIGLFFEEWSQKCNRKAKIAAIGFSNAQWQQYVGALNRTVGNISGVELENIVADGVLPQDFFRLVEETSARKDISGVLVQQPLPKEFADAVNFISPQKDLDCLGALSVAKLYKDEPQFSPATPLAVLKLLDFYGVDLQGKNVVIVGRGNAVGKPLALMCLKRNATVTVCHTKTVNLQKICQNADVIISACGVAGLISANFVSSHCVVVDVGLSFVDGKTCGDVATEVQDIASAVSPVPGGVGPVTRAALLCNLKEAAKLQD